MFVYELVRQQTKRSNTDIKSCITLGHWADEVKCTLKLHERINGHFKRMETRGLNPSWINDVWMTEFQYVNDNDELIEVEYSIHQHHVQD